MAPRSSGILGSGLPGTRDSTGVPLLGAKAENAAASRHTDLRPLSEVNREPGGQTISTVVRILNAIMRPLTKRDWRGAGGG